MKIFALLLVAVLLCMGAVEIITPVYEYLSNLPSDYVPKGGWSDEKDEHERSENVKKGLREVAVVRLKSANYIHLFAAAATLYFLTSIHQAMTRKERSRRPEDDPLYEFVHGKRPPSQETK